MNHARTLTVTSRHGLSNRLRVLLSGSVLAQHTARAFAMLWPPTSGCAATFPQLFQNGWNVKDECAPANVKELDLTLQMWSEFPDLTASPAPALFVAYYGWLFEPRLYAQHAALMQRCANLMNELEPLPEIQHRIILQREQFRAPVIGVHLRRGDFVDYHPDVSNTLEFAIRAVEHFLERAADAQIFYAPMMAHPGTARANGCVIWASARNLANAAPFPNLPSWAEMCRA